MSSNFWQISDVLADKKFSKLLSFRNTLVAPFPAEDFFILASATFCAPAKFCVIKSIFS